MTLRLTITQSQGSISMTIQKISTLDKFDCDGTISNSKNKHQVQWHEVVVFSSWRSCVSRIIEVNNEKDNKCLCIKAVMLLFEISVNFKDH